MKNFIEKPIKNNFWDPSKGDYINYNVLKEDKQYTSRQKRKNFFISFLAFIHLLLLVLVFVLY
mgnify:CR=1 FL=1